MRMQGKEGGEKERESVCVCARVRARVTEQERNRRKPEHQTHPPCTMHRPMTVTRRTVTAEVVAGVGVVGAPAAFSDASCWLVAADVREVRCVPIAPGCVITTPARCACPPPYTSRAACVRTPLPQPRRLLVFVGESDTGNTGG